MRFNPGISVPTISLLMAPLLLSCGGQSDEPSAAPSSASGSAASTSASPSADDQALLPVTGDGFTVLMPGEPERSEQKVASPAGRVTLVSYVSETQDQAYYVGYTIFPKGTDVDLHGSVVGAADAVGGTVEDEVEATHRGLPARDARITGAQAAGVKATFYIRVIAAKDRLFQLQYVAKGADVQSPPASFAEFRDSLKVR